MYGKTTPREGLAISNNQNAPRADVERQYRDCGIWSGQTEETFQRLVDEVVEYKKSKA